jgi:hypothetical protein
MKTRSSPIGADPTARPKALCGIGFNRYLNRNFRLMINLEQTNFAGCKTSPAAVGAQDDETALLSRIHPSF